MGKATWPDAAKRSRQDVDPKDDRSGATNPNGTALPDLDQLMAEVAKAQQNIAAATSRADVAAKHLLVRLIHAEKRAEIFAEELSRAKAAERLAATKSLSDDAAD